MKWTSVLLALALIPGGAFPADDSCPRRMGGDDGVSLIPAYATANNTFGWDVFERLADTAENVAFSSLSSSFGLLLGEG